MVAGLLALPHTPAATPCASPASCSALNDARRCTWLRSSPWHALYHGGVSCSSVRRDGRGSRDFMTAVQPSTTATVQLAECSPSARRAVLRRGLVGSSAQWHEYNLACCDAWCGGTGASLRPVSFGRSSVHPGACDNDMVLCQGVAHPRRREPSLGEAVGQVCFPPADQTISPLPFSLLTSQSHPALVCSRPDRCVCDTHLVPTRSSVGPQPGPVPVLGLTCSSLMHP